MNDRIWISGAAVLLALASASAALVVNCPPASAPAVRAAAVETSAPVSPPAEPVYLVRAYSGELCVFQSGQLVERTGIPVSTLPRSDRELAEVGITVVGQAALSELLGDLGS